MQTHAMVLLLALTLCSVRARVLSVSETRDPLDNNNNDVVKPSSGHEDVIGVLGRASSSASWWGITRCVVAASPLDCVESRSQHAVDAMLAQMSEARAGGQDDAALEPEVIDKVSELSEVVVEAASTMLQRKLGIGKDEDSTKLVEEGRGKKKKKIHKLIALVKLVLLVLVVKLKLAFLMMALQTLFQFKIMVMVFLILITKKICLWAQLKHKKEDAQKVIYYEHAQHQHHYDDHAAGWGGGHDEHVESGHGSGGGGWGGLWGRSYETAQAAGAAGTGTAAVGVQSGVYRAADGTRIVVRPPGDAHDLAYGAQRPS